MRIVGMPGCCTASVLVEFGQERNAEFGLNPGDVNQARLNELLEYRKRYGTAYVIATLTERQTDGIKLLKDNGFTHTEFIEKPRHEDSKVAVFTLNLREWEPKKVVGGGHEWFIHRGGEKFRERVRMFETVEVIFRNGNSARNRVSELYWDHGLGDWDIVKYRRVDN